MTPYYDDGQCVIYHGDCLDVLPQLCDIDLIVTSPPYNLGAGPWPHLGNWKQGDSAGGKTKWANGSDGSAGVTYDDHDDTMPWGDYVIWQRRCLLAMFDALSDSGAIFYNHKTRVIGARLWSPIQLVPETLRRFVRQEIIWARAGGLNFNPTAFVPTHERIYIIAKESWRLKSKAVSGLGDVWHVNQEPSSHPAPFPLGIPARAIEATAPALVLDPFMGSGTTLRAAKNAGVRSIGIELSERYCEIAANRLAQGALDFGGVA